MKNISKLFAAFATVALCTSCGSEDILDNTEGNVPAGMHEVSLTINTNKSRVVIDDESGNLTWETGDVIKVKYTDDKDYDFRIEGSDGSETASFKGFIPEDVYNNYVPQYVYYDGNPNSTDLSVQNNFVANAKGKYSFNGYNVTLWGEANSAGVNKCVDDFSATIVMRDACMLRVAKEHYSVLSETLDSKTNYYVKVDLGYDSELGNGVSESYKVNNIKVDAEGNPAEDLTFFVTNTSLSSNLFPCNVRAFINDDQTNPYHTSYEGTEPNVVKSIHASERFMLTPYTWVRIYDKMEGMFQLIKCEDNNMIWQDYASVNSDVKIDGDKVGFYFYGTAFQMYYDNYNYPPKIVKSSDKVSLSDGLTIVAEGFMY